MLCAVIGGHWQIPAETGSTNGLCWRQTCIQGKSEPCGKPEFVRVGGCFRIQVFPGSQRLSAASQSYVMPSTQTFEKDTQFMRLVRREPDVDLIVAALEIARDGQPDLEFEPTLMRIRSAVSEMTRPITLAGGDVKELHLLIEYLTEELNLRGDHDCFDEANASYINCVVESGRGIPITLSLIYMAVANELGIALKGVAAPAHFLTQLQTDSGLLYIDPFRRGHVMKERECVQWLHDITELPKPDLQASLKPTTERRIVIRMLSNLKALFGNAERWRSAWRVQQRLALLSPSSYREKRDLAILTLRAGRPGEALNLLHECSVVCDPAERPVIQQNLKEARRAAPSFN